MPTVRSRFASDLKLERLPEGLHEGGRCMRGAQQQRQPEAALQPLTG
jgi:hypothetical protein